MNGVKAGVKSSEFWVMIVVQVLNLFKMFFPAADIDPSGQGTLAVNGLAAIYVIGRSILKAISAKKVTEISTVASAILIGSLCFSLFGCAGQTNITKAYNAISAAQAGYNPAGPILISLSEQQHWSEEKKAKVEAADKVVHDAIVASWASLYSWKQGQGNSDTFTQTLKAILSALTELSDVVGDSKVFKDIVLGIQTALNFYLEINPQSAQERKILNEFSISLEQLAESGRLNIPEQWREAH